MTNEKKVKTQAYKVNESLTDIDEAFPANALEYMPAHKDIPYYDKRREMEDLVNRWFFDGLKDVALHSKEGIPGAAALRHLKCIMGSFAPKHEHKISAVAFLLNEWFDVKKRPAHENPSPGTD